MNKKQILKSFKLLSWLLFILYLVSLIYIVILKYGRVFLFARHSTKLSFMQKISSNNYIPFKTIIYYLQGNPNLVIARENILGNILAFCPLGFLLPILFDKCKKIKKVFLISVIVSLIIEIIQTLFNLGCGDIDDIILNVLGGILGFEVYKVLNFTIKK